MISHKTLVTLALEAKAAKQAKAREAVVRVHLGPMAVRYQVLTGERLRTLYLARTDADVFQLALAEATTETAARVAVKVAWSHRRRRPVRLFKRK